MRIDVADKIYAGGTGKEYAGKMDGEMLTGKCK